LGRGRVQADHCGRAIVMMVLSGLSFALVAVMVRLAGEIPLVEKVFFRSVVMLVVTVALATRARENTCSRVTRACRCFFFAVRSARSPCSSTSSPSNG
jgi:hypothetical protein